MIYQYSPLFGTKDLHPAIYPLIPIFIIYKHQMIPQSLNCLVDSGAEECYCLKSIGDYLRIDFHKKKQISSTAANGTQLVGYLESIRTMVHGKKIESPFIFSDDLNPQFPIILGQKGFFSQFKICFNKSKNQFSLD